VKIGEDEVWYQDVSPHKSSSWPSFLFFLLLKGPHCAHVMQFRKLLFFSFFMNDW